MTSEEGSERKGILKLSLTKGREAFGVQEWVWKEERVLPKKLPDLNKERKHSGDRPQTFGATRRQSTRGFYGQ